MTPTLTALTTRSLPALALAATLALVAPLTSAQNMVSIQGASVNMRSGPGLKDPVQWTLSKGYPLRVTARRGDWLQVSDFEGDSGWVSRRLTGSTPHHVVKVPQANLRAGPGTGYRKVGEAAYGEVFRTVEKRPSWVRVSAGDGRKGWMARSLLWGW